MEPPAKSVSTLRSELQLASPSLSSAETRGKGGCGGADEPARLAAFGPRNPGGENRPLRRKSPRLNPVPQKTAGSRHFSGDKCLRGSPWFSQSSRRVALFGRFSDGGDGSVSSRKSGAHKLLLHASPVRRSPRVASLRGEINKVGPAAGETSKWKKERFLGTEKGNIDSAIVESEGSGCERLTFKERSTIAKNLEEESLWEYQDKSNCSKGRSRSNKESAAKPLILTWKGDDSNALSAMECHNPNLHGGKQLRRSQRFIQVMEDDNSEDYLGGPNKQRNNISCEKPSRRSPRFTEATENGYHIEFSKTIENGDTRSSGVKQERQSAQLVHINGNNSVNEAIKMNNDGPGSPTEKQLSMPPTFTNPTRTDGSDESLIKSGILDLNAWEILISSSNVGERTKNGGNYECLRKLDNNELIFSREDQSKRPVCLNETQKNGDINKFCIKSDMDVPGEMHMSSAILELSDSSNERMAKKIKISVENLHMKISNGKIPRQAARTSTRQSVAKGEDKTFTMIVSSKSIEEEECAKKTLWAAPKKEEREIEKSTSYFIGDPIPSEEAQERWRWRYDVKNNKSMSKIRESGDDDEDKIVSNVECHYSQAKIKGCTFSLGDFAYIRGEEAQKHVGKILEFFKTTDCENYFRVQWFYKAEDTVMKQEASFHDKRRLFYSTIMNDNPIECIISNVSISQVSPRAGLKPNSMQSEFYFDMEYCVEYSTFRTLKNYKSSKNNDLSVLHCIEAMPRTSAESLLDDRKNHGSQKKEMALLDLYSGCGGMSTGLCLGAKISGVNLVTRWAVDSDRSACESLKLNHPNTHVWNDAAGDFLNLLKEWDKLCNRYVFNDEQRIIRSRSMASTETRRKVSSRRDDDSESGEFEVEKLVDISYGDPSNTGKHGLKYKVHWKGYSTSDDTWEPAEGLSNCQECIRDFVRNGHKSKILPLPGDADVICGGPPCQGISGYNRFRHINSPLTDERNRQIVVFMDIVKFLKPRFVLMENVVDILRFDKGSLGRYALSRLVDMKYQARLGIMAAGCYGLAQFRLRVFLWGAHPNKKLPQFPLPTHDVIVKYGSPPEFERNIVAYDEGQPRELEKALVLKDAISDLPPVSNDEDRAALSYERPPETEFQRYIKSTKYEMTGSATTGSVKVNILLHDHRPHRLFEDNYARVCQIPKRKGANFRDLPGIVVGNDGAVHRDPSRKQVMLPSGKPLVPDYVFTFEQGKSKRPFARLWWDEIVPTVLTFPSCNSQASLHPEQDRMLTIREFARLQGFPDYYRFSGTVKERYCQIGNAVAVSVSRALGYALGMAFRGLTGEEPLIKLPPNFSHSNYIQLREMVPP